MRSLLDMKPKKDDLERTQNRLRELTERACQVLDVETLRVMAYRVEVYLKVEEWNRQKAPKLVARRQRKS